MKLLNHLVLFSALATGQRSVQDRTQIVDYDDFYQDVEVDDVEGIEGIDARGRNKKQAIANGTYKRPTKTTAKPKKQQTRPTKKPTYTTTRKTTTKKPTTTTTTTSTTTTITTTTTTTTTTSTTTSTTTTPTTTTSTVTEKATTKGNPYAAMGDDSFPDVTSTVVTTTPGPDNRDQMKEIYNTLTGSSWTGPTADEVFNYGCWCNMNNGLAHVTKGKGQALDKLDEVCQSWHRCTTCVRMDDTDCVPLSQEYDFLTGTKYNPTVSCKDNAPGCADWACQCDVTFVKRVIKLVEDGEFTPTLSHSNKSWNSDSMCRWQGDFEVQDECCGTIPDRFPFATNFGARACCGSKTYQTESHDCCEGDKIRPIGKCGDSKPEPSNPYAAMGAFAPGPADSAPAGSVMIQKGTQCGRDRTNEPLEVIFVVDISSSIAPKVQEGMNGLWKWLNNFTRQFDFTEFLKMGIITFNSDANVEAQLDHYTQIQIDNKIFKTLSDIAPVEESDLNRAMKAARKEFKTNGTPEADKAIVLVTDGWSTATNTPFYHSNLAVREGIDVFTIGFGPVLNKEYLYTTTMGKEENIHSAADFVGLQNASPMLERQICGVALNDVLFQQAIWQQQRYDVNAQLYAAMGGRYDNTQTIDIGRVRSLEKSFDAWFSTGAEFGIQADMRRLNMTVLEF